jgi:ABC-type Mn2+/Zn2+ transport system ATPase subunit
MNDKLIVKLHLSKLRCGASIPGVNQKHHKDLIDDASKLRDFFFVVPLLWSTIVNFGFNIYMMESSSEYPIRTIYTLLCVSLCVLVTWLTDPSVYERTKPSTTSVTRFQDTQFVKMKMSMGCKLDKDFEKNKRNKMDKQQNYQKYVIMVLNMVTTYLSLVNKNIGQLHAFGNISWMIGCLSDNLKSLQYYTYMVEFISFLKCMKAHKLECEVNTVPIGRIDEVAFINASFGYYSDDLMKNPTRIQKITNLTYTFKRGILYYLEAPNGIGKSTMLRMFLSNLFSGEVFFGAINRKNLSFTDIYNSVFHIVQASEYTPKFSKEEIQACKGRDEWLEERLGLADLFDKDTVEMSGGQKKRMLLYILMTSSSPILLLDEILSELSTEDIPEVQEGGGWLTRVINTLVQWPNREQKIVILVGHGLRTIIPNVKSVIQLSIENTESRTLLSVRE